MTRFRVVLSLTCMFVFVSASPTMARFAQTSVGLDGPSDWTKLVRELGIPGSMAAAFAWSAWKITPKILAILNLLFGNLSGLIASNEATQQTNREVMAMLRELRDREENDRDKLLKRALAALEATKKDPGS